jgi:hypothetical protein
VVGYEPPQALQPCRQASPGPIRSAGCRPPGGQEVLACSRSSVGNVTSRLPVLAVCSCRLAVSWLYQSYIDPTTRACYLSHTLSLHRAWLGLIQKSIAEQRGREPMARDGPELNDPRAYAVHEIAGHARPPPPRPPVRTVITQITE